MQKNKWVIKKSERQHYYINIYFIYIYMRWNKYEHRGAWPYSSQILKPTKLIREITDSTIHLRVSIPETENIIRPINGNT
jgi:hypothetical protein